jgi:hypothetical protein
MITRTIVALAMLAGCWFPALAGQIEDMAREAAAKAKAGDPVAAVEILRQAIATLTAEGPLSLRRVQFVAEPPKGFGIYKPRADNVFKPGEPLIIYAEPVGMGWKAENGMRHALVAADFEIRTPAGKILGGQKNFGRFEFTSHEQNQEVMTHLTIRLSGAPAGKYVFAATYRDQMNGKSVDLSLPFEIK